MYEIQASSIIVICSTANYLHIQLWPLLSIGNHSSSFIINHIAIDIIIMFTISNISWTCSQKTPSTDFAVTYKLKVSC
jgi:hypothetical protein